MEGGEGRDEEHALFNVLLVPPALRERVAMVRGRVVLACGVTRPDSRPVHRRSRGDRLLGQAEIQRRRRGGRRGRGEEREQERSAVRRRSLVREACWDVCW